jgi:tRNA U34 5-methylaminomethyl-2-thiouridine-forming methyltransferase MnmC
MPHQPIHILEIGFGTGLNALLSLREAIRHRQSMYYQTVELFPLHDEIVTHLNYGEQLNLVKEFGLLHSAPWETPVPVHPLFTLHKTQDSLLSFSTGQLFHCIYFDVFAPAAQPELWTQEVFEKMYNFITPGGTLVTYCSKSIVRKAMMAAGFIVEKIPGPHGKREMVRAGKARDL